MFDGIKAANTVDNPNDDFDVRMLQLHDSTPSALARTMSIVQGALR